MQKSDTAICMAHPIEATPILKGEDAKRFWKEMNRKKPEKELEANKKLMKESTAIYQHFKEACDNWQRHNNGR
jgi:hypothetical protein